MTSGWIGVDNDNAYEFNRCWSIHPKSNDIAQGSHTEAKSNYSGLISSNPVSRDFSCDNMNACYESELENNPYWMADLGTPKSVSEVRIHNHLLLHPTAVEFRLGNDTNVVNNPFFVTSFTLVSNEELFLKPPAPVIGQYFFVTEPFFGDIRVCDVWIIGTHTVQNWNPGWCN